MEILIAIIILLFIIFYINPDLKKGVINKIKSIWEKIKK